MVDDEPSGTIDRNHQFVWCTCGWLAPIPQQETDRARAGAHLWGEHTEQEHPDEEDT